MCYTCPDNTARLLDNENTAYGPNSKITECICDDGYYSVNGTTGVKCLTCPKGAICDGRSSPPRAKKGYWRSALTVYYQDKTWLSSSSQISYQNERFFPCNPWYACDNTEMANFAIVEESSMTSSSSNLMKLYHGNINGTTKCDGHRQGIRCQGVRVSTM